ncbi:MAG: HAD hydrolase-like protein [Spirulinaceae cyanobacterium]
MINVKVLALDFDGVLCDGLVEYFQTTCKTYAQIWQSQPNTDLATVFYRLRPVIETGWEMPVLLRALVLGVTEAEISTNWPAVVAKIVVSEKLDSTIIARQLDAVRDEWIKTDLEGWLGLHSFYPGVIDQVKRILASSTQLFIITTKEGRFAQKLLQGAGVALPGENIFGKEVKRPKHQSLRELITKFSVNNQQVGFVEDRLKTLHSVAKQPDLKGIQLFLADWGYNTELSHQSIQDNPQINLLSLNQFIHG